MSRYVVRIYRREKDNPRRLVGVVEEVGGKTRQAFTNLSELWEILNARKEVRRGRRKEGGEAGKV